ncbi:hypothetical protein Tco_0588707 [Tanacetum coccineum]
MWEEASVFPKAMLAIELLRILIGLHGTRGAFYQLCTLLAFSDSERCFLQDSDIRSLKTGLFAPPSVDLSSLGIEKFKEPEFEGYGFESEDRKTSSSSTTKEYLISEDSVKQG